jgi:hypothetical protein
MGHETMKHFKAIASECAIRKVQDHEKGVKLEYISSWSRLTILIFWAKI